MSINRVTLVGFVGKDVDLKQTAGGLAVCEFTLATSQGKDKETEWHNIKTFDKLAETCHKHVFKGNKIYIEGRITTRSWADKNSGEKKYRTEIIAHTVEFMSGREVAPTIADLVAGKLEVPRMGPPATIGDGWEDIPF